MWYPVINEGVDVPAVDTLLMLTPTDSPTLFLQQLGAWPTALLLPKLVDV